MSNPETTEPNSVSDLLALGSSHRKRRRGRPLALLALALLALATLAYWIMRPQAPAGPQYDVGRVSRGPLRVTVTATGTLSARDAVEVGSEITGRVIRVPVDFNDEVDVGTILAEIDTEQYQARLDEARAQRAAARAALVNAEVTAKEAELKATRLAAMTTAGLSTQQELEAAEAARDRARASVDSARAQLTSSQASLKVAQNNLSKAVIVSPIEGIVLERSVEPGQTVTSGLQTPVLFTLAADLAELRLDVKVDEADVGQVHAGQGAEFSVDAYPSRVFTSTVLAVKNMPTTDQSVVTYETRLSVKNDQGLLRPGMTATATILVEELKGTLLVPNAALRYRPSDASSQEAAAMDFTRMMRGRPPRPTRGKASAGAGRSSAAASASAARAGSGGQAAPGRERTQATLYALRAGKPTRLTVQASASDGLLTAIASDELKVDEELVLGELAKADD